MKHVLISLLSIWVVFTLMCDARPAKVIIPKKTMDRKTLRKMRRITKDLLYMAARTPIKKRQTTEELVASNVLAQQEKLSKNIQKDMKYIMRDEKMASIKNSADPDKTWTQLLAMMGLSDETIRNMKPSQPVTIQPSRSLKHKLYCKNGLFLEILDNGTVRGTWQTAGNPYVKLIFHMLGRQLVQIQSGKNKLYLAMDSQGKVYGSKEATMETVFFFDSNKHYYLLFQNLYYRAYLNKEFWYLGLRKNGQPKKGSTTTSDKNNSQFLLPENLE